MSSRRYTLIELLGAGGYGEVWRARMDNDAGFTRECAIKLLRPNADEDAARRLRDEARILGMVQHRGVVQVFDLTQIRGRWAVVMELIEGAPLSYFTQYGRRVPLGPALEIVCQVAEVLVALGEARAPDGAPLGLLHRDIKPSNLQLTADGSIKVLDFGIAQARFDAREAETTGVGYGTRSYMAPERAGDGAAGPAADVFALGVVLFELVAGRRFGLPALEEERFAAQRGAALAHLHGAPAGLLGLLSATLSYAPEDRPGAARVLARAHELLAECAGQPSLAEWSGPEVRHALAPSGASGPAASALARIATTTAKGALRFGVLLSAVLGVTMGFAVASMLGGLPWSPALESSASSPAPQDRPHAELPGRPPAPSRSSPDQPRSSRPLAGAPTQGLPEARPGGPQLELQPQAPPGVAMVSLRGDVQDVTLVGEAGRFPLPAEVPAGLYRIEALFPRWGVSSEEVIIIPTSGSVQVSCSNQYGSCGLGEAAR